MGWKVKLAMKGENYFMVDTYGLSGYNEAGHDILRYRIGVLIKIWITDFVQNYVLRLVLIFLAYQL